MASLTKKGKVWYAIFYEGRGNDRKKKWKALSTDKPAAQVKFGDLVQELDAHKYNHPQKSISWMSFCEKYLAYSQTNKKPQTYEHDIRTIRILNRMFSISSPDDLTPRLLEEFKAISKADGKRESSINRYIGTFKAMANRATEWGYLKNNPVGVVKKLKTGRNRPRYFNKDEIKAILECTTDTFERVMVLMGLYTGMRREEICRLTWEDVDWGRKLIQIVGRDGWTPKDYEAREIPLHPVLEKVLRGWKRENGQAPYLFSLHDRKPDGIYLLRIFKRIIKNAGVKGNFHTMRHTYASHLVNAGVDLYTVSKLLGHASVKTTEIYAHLQPSSLHQAVLKLDL